MRGSLIPPSEITSEVRGAPSIGRIERLQVGPVGFSLARWALESQPFPSGFDTLVDESYHACAVRLGFQECELESVLDVLE